jgi:hypothetical protein
MSAEEDADGVEYWFMMMREGSGRYVGTITLELEWARAM